MVLLDGKILSAKIKEEVKVEVTQIVKEKNITPGLAVILVGNDAASATYVASKAKACKDAGIYSVVHEMPESITQEELLETINMMNNNPKLDGILVQLPLPKHIDTTTVLEAINPLKDVDGFHPYNVGRMVSNLDSFLPATPFGVMRMFEEHNIELSGKDVVVIGSSDIVGKPMASLLINKKATVTVCNSRTKDLKAHTSKADIVIIAVGVPYLLKEDMVKDGAVVIDVGINRLDTGKLVGDADFEGLKNKCSHLTPVPGGVGPMTIAMLLKNTIKAANLRDKRETK
ncbi:bifunctional methylenetetrahydrofolate dehydrogenase/methenyltetrahydrofolate cyclohydrolase FolD [Aliarcobacter cryaerophilus]|jgi:methylenetetrahydrofolate dehydrogenase (NADP+)/methenyltetrahydrofolate cyclohydrolase|uniref:bifunctional methylenetetrahydrofolate dehydrogenase/methenyltetrahydrofolate cyclohydrolase FolD n=1 Tax=Aliarcobacter cryaerophilus TaxID=28198 RepID=UPI0008241F7C|nr:bifunctional methylenetetrahydrofolate dehydrogenase/methenyltetrahydrofolate cyclohydrolase FolD [Aliarcobacter cryaerophilus]MCD8541392.1 bifunctional methylenetetrahydrofolate dehydrogenase/methenyltetrahydrofolate cyclohydrolase FolD [Aliarcobacter cryaerophilus]MCT7444862.1 bifunctional methylenetetrahydrofolate dehydrogenase/methenyltetrahydrofolate cyclohydrolase FolD [Aliarcobacter cryaerophilus]MCT7479525.1 bifunctional methylenetetrahydrofolate dehydrogenase/methenyltetrahydrofolate